MRSARAQEARGRPIDAPSIATVARKMGEADGEH
jgi:hypothetical protein